MPQNRKFQAHQVKPKRNRFNIRYVDSFEMGLMVVAFLFAISFLALLISRWVTGTL